MSDSVRYADYWAEGRGASAITWIDAAEAQQRYESSASAFTAVGTDGVSPRPRWALTVAVNRCVRVVFLDPHRTRTRSVDYDWREGRLWRWITTDFEYPDRDRRYRRERAVRTTTAVFEPDGSARVQVIDRAVAADSKDVLTLEDAPVQGFWLERPAFGQWSDLINPEYGIPPEGRTRQQ
ncbi:hypothetical protein ACTHAM_001500 [Cellulomonas soli]|uniref:hypothetical protein n=1 Tax=Cellulomonas soli TaxID=931535 RepID=UPI003F87F089